MDISIHQFINKYQININCKDLKQNDEQFHKMKKKQIMITEEASNELKDKKQANI